MTDMIERVAKAMQADYRKVMGGAPNIQTFRKWAKIAIAAMRDPTEDMLDAFGPFRLTDRFGQPEYRAMIDAALEEK